MGMPLSARVIDSMRSGSVQYNPCQQSGLNFPTWPWNFPEPPSNLLEILEGTRSKRTHCLLDPYRLRSCPLSHLIHVWEIPHAPPRLVIRRERVLLPRLPQQPLHCHLTPRQRRRVPVPVRLLGLRNPPSIHQNRRASFPLLVRPLERRDDEEAVLAVVEARADQHLLAMVEHARGVDAAVVEVGDGGRVDARRQRQRRLDQPVLEARDQVGLPAQALDLPCPEGEGGDGDERWDS